MVQTALKKIHFGHVFVFRVGVVIDQDVVVDGDGLCLLQKNRRGKFTWPQATSGRSH